MIGIAIVTLMMIGDPAASKSCVIVHAHEKKMAESLIRWTPAKPFDFVEGSFPKGMKFHYEISDKTVRLLQQQGGKMVVLKPDYSMTELEDARQQCKTFQGDK